MLNEIEIGRSNLLTSYKNLPFEKYTCWLAEISNMTKGHPEAPVQFSADDHLS